MSAPTEIRGLRVAFAGGGTGGHIMPGRHLLARAQACLGDVLWFCTGRAVEDPAFAGLDRELDATPHVRVALRLEPDGGGAPNLGRLLARSWPAFLEARGELVRRRSQVLLGLGGFTCLPAVLAARSLGIPVALLEINAARGKATRVLAPFARRVFHAWPSTLPRGVESDRDRWTGPPLAPQFAEVPVEGAPIACAAFGFDPERPLLVVLGGSQGAGALNQFLAAHVDEFLRRGVQVLHQTGPGRLEQGASARQAYVKVEFIDDVQAALRASTLVLCRGGASTLAEVAAMRRAAWVVPYPHHRDQHQTKNALQLGAGARIVEESRLTAAFARELVQMTTPSGRLELQRMSGELERVFPPDAASRIWSELAVIARRATHESPPGPNNP
jgi:UDP-N-acetylglucosamine--N-acetylmuramyl-(pentapeptide) pyrophosphoryl-undecaprenol N-acetylglucosamine transferase